MSQDIDYVVFDKFDGGINTFNALTNLKPNELEDCQNVYPESRGAIRKIKGWTKFLSTDAGGSAVTGLYEFQKKDGTRFKIKVQGAAIYVWNTSTLAWDNKTGSCTITSNKNYQWRFADMGDKVFAVNGYDAPIYWDGAAASFSTFSGANIPSTAEGLFVWQNRLWFFCTTEAATLYPMRVRASDNGDPSTFSDANAFVDVDGAFGGRFLTCVYPDRQNYAYAFCIPKGVYILIWDAT
ncbi:MAG: hypothetical protein AAB538_00590, partial [Patescibacteria group bacterium]